MAVMYIGLEDTIVIMVRIIIFQKDTIQEVIAIIQQKILLASAPALEEMWITILMLHIIPKQTKQNGTPSSPGRNGAPRLTSFRLRLMPAA